MRRLLPLLLAVLGLSAGTGAGYFLRPAHEAAPDPATEGAPPDEGTAGHAVAAKAEAGEFVRLNNQFVVPLVEGGRIAGMVVLSLSLEVDPGASQQVFATEPRLRDALLRTLFEHANAGGFSANFTRPSAMTALRAALVEAARGVLGKPMRDVLILDVLRQDS